MLRPLQIGLPIVILIAVAFVVAMNTVSFTSPYFMWVIVGYVVLFPAALAFTIIGTIRSAKRVMVGGDPALKETGERTMATVVAARRLNMTMRLGGGPRMQMFQVRLKPDNHTPEISTTKTAGPLVGAPEAGDRVPLYLDRDNAKNFFVDWAQSSGAQRVDAGSDIGQIVSQLQAAAIKMSQDAAQYGQQQAAAFGVALDGHDTPEPPRQPEAPPSREPPVEPWNAGGGGLEGRARIEGLKPYPDGTYDLDLYVTPRGKSSYRVAARIPVPAGAGLLERGQMLKVRIDPDIASRVEIVWD